MNLTALRDVLDHDGPFASVHLDATHDTEDAAKVMDLRWRAIRAELAEQDTPETTLTALDEAIGSRPPPAGRAGRLLVAARDAVLVDEYLPAPPTQPRARLSPLPYLLPLVTWDHRTIPHVIAVVDRVGADLRAVDADGAVRTDDPVTGRKHPVHKVRGGGWSHRSVQRHTEETVRQNIHDVAGETAELVRRVDARLLVLAGDAQPRAQLRKALPASCQRIAAEIEHGRSPDPSHRTVDRDITTLLAEQLRTERDQVLEQFRTELGREQGLAVQGLPNTTAALREANADLLLVDTQRLNTTTVWTGAHPAMVATDQADLHRIGVSGRIHARADEALPAAAIAVGADVLADPSDEEQIGLADGVGALLRHT